MCTNVVRLVREGGMRKGRTKNRSLNDTQSYHSAWGKFRLAEVTFEEGHSTVSRRQALG